MPKGRRQRIHVTVPEAHSSGSGGTLEHAGAGQEWQEANALGRALKKWRDPHLPLPPVRHWAQSTLAPSVPQQDGAPAARGGDRLRHTPHAGSLPFPASFFLLCPWPGVASHVNFWHFHPCLRIYFW